MPLVFWWDLPRQLECNLRKDFHDSSEVMSKWHRPKFNKLFCVQEASDKGFFRPNGVPDFTYILAAAADIAAGMAFLHSKGVAHGDLTGGNVLLASDKSSPSGVVAKVADFGLARAMDVKSKIETRTYGTVTHMPPELLEKGIFSKVQLFSRRMSHKTSCVHCSFEQMPELMNNMQHPIRYLKCQIKVLQRRNVVLTLPFEWAT